MNNVKDVLEAHGIPFKTFTVVINYIPLVNFIPVPKTQNQKDILRAYGIPYVENAKKNK